MGTTFGKLVRWACERLQLTLKQVRTQINPFPTLLLLCFGFLERQKKGTTLLTLEIQSIAVNSELDRPAVPVN